MANRLQSKDETAKMKAGRNTFGEVSGPDHSEPDKEVRTMADYGQYPDSGVEFNKDLLADGDMAEALGRVLDYGIPYKTYSRAFQCEPGYDRSAYDCSDILSALVDAAIWGASNARQVLATRQVEETDDVAALYGDGGEE